MIYQYKPQSRPLCQQTELISPRNHLTVKVLSAQIEEVNTLKPWAWYLNTPLYGLNNSKSNLYPYMCTYFFPSIIFFLLAFCHQTHNDIWLSCASLWPCLPKLLSYVLLPIQTINKPYAFNVSTWYYVITYKIRDGLVLGWINTFIFFSFTNGALRSKSVMFIKFLQASTLVVIHLISNYYIISL